ncbi:BTB/POZ and MATH domain-containing protein 1-like [Panicum virgatum]|uniref:BTB/POZ and MATH domain-containing protein 1-like n=1 Tax=Panicum virgatum TaxID=38727 RepID=UPI0019D637EE|nr:BTB/POZ and MATH domain-containing protein 1-like [Panicum virgatum]
MSSSPASWDCDGSGSASTTFAVKETGWHVFQAEYSEFNGIGAMRHIKSSTFFVGGHSWLITFFPDGLSEDVNKDWICFGLHLEKRGATGSGVGGREVTVLAKFSLLDEAGDPSYTKADKFTFARTFESLALQRFIRRKEFESSYVRDGRFSVRCDLSVVEKVCTEVLVPPPELHRHLADLLASGIGSDVTLEVGEEEFKAHKSMLAARSPVFKVEFFGGPLMENTGDRAKIDDMEPRVFKALLGFIYTDSLPEIEPTERVVMAQHLLVAADKYDIQRLKSICEYILCTYLNASVAATTLVLAEQHRCHRLKEACLRILKSPDNKVALGCDDCQYLLGIFPSLLKELHETAQNTPHCPFVTSAGDGPGAGPW